MSVEEKLAGTVIAILIRLVITLQTRYEMSKQFILHYDYIFIRRLFVVLTFIPIIIKQLATVRLPA
jgi:hypothetical protein